LSICAKALARLDQMIERAVAGAVTKKYKFFKKQ